MLIAHPSLAALTPSLGAAADLPRWASALAARGRSRAPAGGARAATAAHDLREFTARLADKDALVASERARAAELIAEKDARLAEKDARLAEKDAEKDARLTDKDARFNEAERFFARLVEEKDAHAAAVHARISADLQRALFDADVARHRLGVRAIFEASLADIWRRFARNDKAVPSQRLAELLRVKGDGSDEYPGFVAYLSAAATDNGVGQEPVLKAAAGMYATLSTLAHGTDVGGGGDTLLPVAIFESWGLEALVAYAATVRFAGRRLSLYLDNGGTRTIKLRTLCERAATVEAVLASPLEDV